MNDPRKIIDAFIDSIYAGNMDVTLGYLAPDIQIHHVTRLPYSGEYRGHEGFKALLAKMGGFWESFEAGDKRPNVVVDGATAVVIGQMNGRSRAGHILSIPVLERYRFADGKIAEIWPFYVDTHLTAKETA